MADLKPGWKRVKFGEVVARAVESAVPTDEESATYIGLEHMDADSWTIRRYGSDVPLEVPKTRIRKGDVLFARRNTHLRRTALAPFDAFFSPDGYAFRTISPHLLQDFLIAVVGSDAFHDFAVKNSAGTHSKRVRWEQLAQYEFALPPLEEQRRMAELLGAASRLLDAAREVFFASRISQTAALHSVFPPNPRITKPLTAYCRNLITYGIVQAGPDTPGGVPYVRVSDMSDGVIAEHGLLRTKEEIAAKYRRSELDVDDLVIALRGPIGLSAPVPSSLKGANLTQGTARVSVRRNWSRDYVRWALAAPSLQSRIAAVSKGSTFKEISLAALRELPIPWLEPEKQRLVADEMNAAASAVRFAQVRLDDAQRLASHIAATVLDSQQA